MLIVKHKPPNDPQTEITSQCSRIQIRGVTSDAIGSITHGSHFNARCIKVLKRDFNLPWLLLCFSSQLQLPKQLWWCLPRVWSHKNSAKCVPKNENASRWLLGLTLFAVLVDSSRVLVAAGHSGFRGLTASSFSLQSRLSAVCVMMLKQNTNTPTTRAPGSHWGLANLVFHFYPKPTNDSSCPTSRLLSPPCLPSLSPLLCSSGFECVHFLPSRRNLPGLTFSLTLLLFVHLHLFSLNEIFSSVLCFEVIMGQLGCFLGSCDELFALWRQTEAGE